MGMQALGSKSHPRTIIWHVNGYEGSLTRDFGPERHPKLTKLRRYV